MANRSITLLALVIVSLDLVTIASADQDPAKVLGLAKSLFELPYDSTRTPNLDNVIPSTKQDEIRAMATEEIGNLTRIFLSFRGSNNHRDEHVVLFGCLFCFRVLAQRGDRTAEGELLRIQQECHLDGAFSVEVKQAIEDVRKKIGSFH